MEGQGGSVVEEKAERLLLPRKSLVLHHHLESSPPMQHARTFPISPLNACKRLNARRSRQEVPKLPILRSDHP